MQQNIFHLLLASFQSCSFMDLRREMSEECQGHFSDKSEPGRNGFLKLLRIAALTENQSFSSHECITITVTQGENLPHIILSSVKRN